MVIFTRPIQDVICDIIKIINISKKNSLFWFNNQHSGCNLQDYQNYQHLKKTLYFGSITTRPNIHISS